MRNELSKIMSAKKVGVGEIGGHTPKEGDTGNLVGFEGTSPTTYELLPNNKMTNSDIYCEQIQKLSDAIAQNHTELISRKSMVLHHDNAREHTSLAIRHELLQLGWDVLLHPMYSPDLAPSDYEVAREIAEGHRIKRQIHHWLFTLPEQ